MGPEFATLFDSLGWAILHSLWQGTLAAVAVVAFRGFTKDSQASLRYGFQSLCLVMCLAAFVATFGLYQVQSGHAAMTSGTSLLNFTTLTAAFSAPAVTPEIAAATDVSLGLYMAPYMPLVGVLWVLGFSLMALKYSTAFILTQRLRNRGLSSVSPEWQRRFSTLVLNAGIRRNVDIFISSKVKGPLTLGFFKPIVLVPAAFFASLPADQVEAILLHEIGHIRRHDYLVNLLQTAIRTIFFFHPAIHYISRKIDHDREHACDDFAVALNRDPDALIRGLAALRMKLSPEPFALAADNGNTPLVSRLKRLGAPTETRRRPEQVMTSVVALLVATGFYVASSPMADAKPVKLAEALVPEPPEHPSARKNNYTFKQVTKDGRTFTAKFAEDGTRWINVKGSWYDIDRSPEMIAELPILPIAPVAPVIEANVKAALDAHLNVNIEKSVTEALSDQKLDQYNIDVDYYVASANHFDEMAGAPKSSKRELKRDIKAAEKAREQALKRAERIREEAMERAEAEIERQMERAEANYERAMEQAEQQRERAEEQRERAMEQAEAHRERAMAQAEREREQAERQAQMAERQRDMMEAQLDRAEEDRDRAMERAEEQREREMERAEEQRERAMERAERQREREEARQEHLQKDAKNYKAFSDAVMAQLRSDGLIAPNSKSVTITYPNKKMAVNGQSVAYSMEGSYCELLDEYGIEKTAQTRIKISPTAFEYSSRSHDGQSRHRVEETFDHAENHTSFKPTPSQISLTYGKVKPISFTPPTSKGWVSSSYGDNRNSGKTHTGIDLAAPRNTTVVASAPGIVTSAELKGRWGNLVTISHGGGYKTRYAHMEKICVEEGQTVSRGQEIGSVGSTGVSTGPHLHFEIHQDDKTHNPEHVIAGLGKT